MLTLIISLFVVGLLLVSFELIVPGGILGLLGGIAILGSFGLTFSEYGTHVGLAALVGGLVVLVLVLFVELKLLPRTRFGKRFFLSGAIDSTSHAPLATEDIVGKEGETLTALAPTGVVLIDDKKYEAFSMSGMLDRGTRVSVVDFDTFRVRVKKL